MTYASKLNLLLLRQLSHFVLQANFDFHSNPSTELPHVVVAWARTSNAFAVLPVLVLTSSESSSINKTRSQKSEVSEGHCEASNYGSARQHGARQGKVGGVEE